jgi:flagellar basal-body rod modification protein FlgD
MLDDMVKLNQVKFFNDIRSFTEVLKVLFNQLTLISSLSLVGKDVIFSTEEVNTVKVGQYYLLSPEDVSQATFKFFDGEQWVSERGGQ